MTPALGCWQDLDLCFAVCPAGWKPGADTIKPGVKESKSYFSKANWMRLSHHALLLHSYLNNTVTPLFASSMLSERHHRSDFYLTKAAWTRLSLLSIVLQKPVIILLLHQSCLDSSCTTLYFSKANWRMLSLLSTSPKFTGQYHWCHTCPCFFFKVNWTVLSSHSL